MSAIRLNGQYVLLRDVEKKDFMNFVHLCLPSTHWQAPDSTAVGGRDIRGFFVGRHAIILGASVCV